MDKKLNPLLTPSDLTFDKVNEDMDALMHVTSMHPNELVDNVIKPMFDLDIATRLLIPHYRCASLHISKFIFANPSMVIPLYLNSFHDSSNYHYEIKEDTRVYYYLINSRNEKYKEFIQVGMRTLHR